MPEKCLIGEIEKAVMDDNQCRRDRTTDLYTVKVRKGYIIIYLRIVLVVENQGILLYFQNNWSKDHILSWSNPGD